MQALRDKALQDSRKERAKWADNCRSELRRTRFLRATLTKDKTDKHLITNIEDSGKAWRECKENYGYKENIEKVRKWRQNNGKPRGPSPRPFKEPDLDMQEKDVPDYELGKDVDVPIIQLDNGKSSNVPSDKYPVWGQFPDQKTTIDSLFNQGDRDTNLLSSSRTRSKGAYGKKQLRNIRYFHIPANNMEWAEEAIARYFNQSRPNFEAMKRVNRKQELNETARILRESHWRGQLHAGRGSGHTVTRFMRPFCDVVSTGERDESEIVPNNIVLFMPYLHWETSRNQMRFSYRTEEILHHRKCKLDREDKEAKDSRKRVREDLTALPRPQLTGSLKSNDAGNSTSTRLDAIRRYIANGFSRDKEQKLASDSVTTDEPSTPRDDDDDEHEAGLWPRIVPSRRIRSFDTLLHWMKLPQNSLKADKYGRVKVGNKLGQYLIDAARLFEGMTSFRDKTLLEQYLVADAPIHPRRTLDQAYYWSLNTTRARDKDQVVYRATTADSANFHRWHSKEGKWKENITQDPDISDHSNCRECTERIKMLSRVVMVDQLWMWILDSQTIITCFPRRYGTNKHDKSGIHKSIRVRLSEGRHHQVKSVFDLALLIFEECSNKFFDQSNTWDKQPRVLDAFSEAIGTIMHKQTVAFDRLWGWTKEARKVYRSRSAGDGSRLHVSLLDIKPEGELEREIKDVVEELGIMIHIHLTQRDVFRQFVSHVEHILDPVGTYKEKYYKDGKKGKAVRQTAASRRQSRVGSPLSTPPEHSANTMGEFMDKPSGLPPQDESPASPKFPTFVDDGMDEAAYDCFKVNAHEMLIRINDRIEQLQELAKNAETTAASVKDLLELKQQQAGVVQAWQAVEQSNVTVRQGHAVMAFTIVTIIFLPLSFMSSIFGMNAIEFGDGNYWSIRTQLKYMFSISAGVVLLTFIFSLTRFPRASIFYVYKRAMTAFCVHTGLYKLYLRYDIHSDNLYVNAVKLTDTLKAKEIEARLKATREQRTENHMTMRQRRQQENLGTDSRAAGDDRDAVQESAPSSQGTKKSHEKHVWSCFRHENTTKVNGTDLEMGDLRS